MGKYQYTQKCLNIIRRTTEWIARAVWENMPILCAVLFTCFASYLVKQSLVGAGSPKAVLLFNTLFEAFVLCVVAKAGGSWVRRLLVFLTCFLFFVDLFLLFSYKTAIGPLAFKLMMQTDQRECGEFFRVAFGSPKTWGVLGGTVLLYVAFWYVGRLLQRLGAWRKDFFHSVWADAAICLVIAATVFGAWRGNRLFVKAFTADRLTAIPQLVHPTPWTRLVVAYQTMRVQDKEAGYLQKTVEKTTVDGCTFRSPNILLIIGESYNKYHSPIYNADAPQTTPNMCRRIREGGMIPWMNVSGTSLSTTSCFCNMFSTCSLDMDSVSWTDYTLFPAVFKRAGYEAEFVSNQFAVADDSNISSSVGGAIFNYGNLSSLQFSRRNSTVYQYDMQLLQDIDKESVADGRPKLTIVHFIGQHSDYACRYPAQNAVFHPEDMKLPYGGNATVAAHYANSLLYNDLVVDSLLRIFDGTETVAIYLSDHAEEVYDYRDYCGREFSSKNPLTRKYMLGVPFIFYATPLYRERHPDIMREISSGAGKTFVTDDICHILFHLAGIDYKDYDATRDPLTTHYVERVKNKTELP